MTRSSSWTLLSTKWSIVMPMFAVAAGACSSIVDPPPPEEPDRRDPGVMVVEVIPPDALSALVIELSPRSEVGSLVAASGLRLWERSVENRVRIILVGVIREGEVLRFHSPDRKKPPRVTVLSASAAEVAGWSALNPQEVSLRLGR